MRLVDNKFVMNLKLEDMKKGIKQGAPIDAFIPYPLFFYEMSNIMYHGSEKERENIQTAADAMARCPEFFNKLLEYHLSMGGKEISLLNIQYFKEWSEEEILESYLVKVQKYVTCECKYGVNDVLYGYMEATLMQIQKELGKDRFDAIVQAKGLTKQLKWIGLNMSKLEIGIWGIKNAKNIWKDIRSNKNK